MTLTPEQLDKLCGGPPTHTVDCKHCGKTWSYYDRSLALDALRVHLSGRHANNLPAVAPDERQGGKKR